MVKRRRACFFPHKEGRHRESQPGKRIREVSAMTGRGRWQCPLRPAGHPARPSLRRSSRSSAPPSPGASSLMSASQAQSSPENNIYRQSEWSSPSPTHSTQKASLRGITDVKHGECCDRSCHAESPAPRSRSATGHGLALARGQAAAGWLACPGVSRRMSEEDRERRRAGQSLNHGRGPEALPSEDLARPALMR